MTGVYTVWRRSDGYVAASKGSRISGKVGDILPAMGTSDGVPNTLEVLLVTTEWPEARDAIVRERAKAMEEGSWPQWAM